MTKKSLLSQHWKVWPGYQICLLLCLTLSDTWQQGTHCTHIAQALVEAQITDGDPLHLQHGPGPGAWWQPSSLCETHDNWSAAFVISHILQPRHASSSIEYQAIIKLGLCDKFDQVYDQWRWDQKSFSFEFEYYISLFTAVCGWWWLAVDGLCSYYCSPSTSWKWCNVSCSSTRHSRDGNHHPQS